MEKWKDFLNTLAGKLTAILAFAVLVLVLIAWFGSRIVPDFVWLIYIIVILAAVIYAALEIIKARQPPEPKTPAAETPPNKKPAPENQPESVSPVSPAPPVYPSPSAPSPDAARRAYLDAVIQDSRPLRLAGLDEHTGDPSRLRLSLEDVYIALNTTTSEEKLKDGKSRKNDPEFLEREREAQPLSALKALAQSQDRRMVLLGFPGTGKSTFVRFLALRMAQELQGEPRSPALESWQGRALLPVTVALGRFAESLPAGVRCGTAQQIETFLVSTLRNDARPEAGAFAPLLLAILEKSGGLFLFDGLDEVADFALRPVVVEAVAAFAEKYSQQAESRFLVTCRTLSYQDARWQLADWPSPELALLNPAQIEQFVTAWYDQHTRLDQSRAIDYAAKKIKLLAAVQPSDRRRRHEIASYPIILTVMAVVHASYELPDSRAQVYERCVDLLLEKWDAKRSIMGKEQTRSLLAELDVPRKPLDLALWEIAYEAHRSHETGRKDAAGKAAGGLVTEELVAGKMMVYLQDLKKVQTFLDYSQSANGLLMLQGTFTPQGARADSPPRKIYTFPHLTFQKYLAARHLEGQGGEAVRRLLDERHDRWRETVKLLAEYLCFERGDRGRMNELLENLSDPFPASPIERDWRALWLAAELLVLYRRALVKPSPFEVGILANLPRLFHTESLTPIERAAAADTLDELGWQPDDLHNFIPLPGLPYPVSIAKYPVTNAQYRRFLEAKDYLDQDLWQDFPKFDQNSQEMQGDWGRKGWDWLQKPEDWMGVRAQTTGGRPLPRYWDDPRFGFSRRPGPGRELV